jgi:heme/copper-type cytochrome/quinol oxidase subunit 2
VTIWLDVVIAVVALALIGLSLYLRRRASKHPDGLPARTNSATLGALTIGAMLVVFFVISLAHRS